MSDSVSCPKCQRRLELSEDSRGREVRCPECQGVFVHGAATDITSQPPPATTPPTEVQPGMPSGRARQRWPALGHDDDEESGDDLAERIRKRGEFRSAAGLAMAVRVVLGLNILASLAMLGGNYLQKELAQRLIERQQIQQAELEDNDTRQQMIAVAHILVYLVTAIVFVVWFYRAHANLTPLGAVNLQYTSGMAAWGWFIPFLNLVRPVQIAQEIWRNSGPAPGSQDAAIPNSALIGLWWFAWLGSNILGYIINRASGAIQTPEGLLAASLGGMVAEAASIIAALFAIAVVSSIDNRQTARADLLGLTSPPA